MSSLKKLTSGEMPQLMNVETAAQHLGVKKGTLHRLHVKGDGPRCFMVGGQRMYAVNDLLSWLESRSVNSSADAIARKLSKPGPERKKEQSA